MRLVRPPKNFARTNGSMIVAASTSIHRTSISSFSRTASRMTWWDEWIRFLAKLINLQASDNYRIILKET
jgi:hypothetical protein